MCEKYILGEPIEDTMPHNLVMFNQIKEVLNEKVDLVKAAESTLFSHKLKIAGTCDLIANYEDRLAIIDYKTSSKLKRKDWIEGYFLQASLYSYMLYEMTGLVAREIVVIIAVEDSLQAQVFTEKPSRYIEKAAKLVNDYHNLYLAA
jgi:genome maintenance exonuclease 1